MLLSDALEAQCDVIERGIPADALTGDSWVQQATLQADSLSQRRSLRAQAAEVGRVLGVAGDLHGIARRLDAYSASDSAVGASGADGALRQHQPAASSASAGPNSKLSRIAVMSVPEVIRSKYQAPSRVSP